MAIPRYAYVGLFVNGSNGMVDIKGINLPEPRPFLAWCYVSMIDSKGTFDADNAVAIEVYKVDTKRTPWIYGGRWGPLGVYKNLNIPAAGGFGQYIEFRLRAYHPEDIEAAGFGVILYE